MYYDEKYDDYIYEKGDRVCISDTGYISNKHLHKGSTGTVTCLSVDKNIIGVSWDSNIAGHTLDGTCKNGYGWWIPAYRIELVDEMPEDEIPGFNEIESEEMDSFIASLI